jgi:hypothetical protein
VPADLDVLAGGVEDLMTFSSAIRLNSGLRSMPLASASTTTASSVLAICATQSFG